MLLTPVKLIDIDQRKLTYHCFSLGNDRRGLSYHAYAGEKVLYVGDFLTATQRRRFGSAFQRSESD